MEIATKTELLFWLLNFIAINSANPETMTNFDKKYFSLNSKICELLDSYSLIYAIKNWR